MNKYLKLILLLSYSAINAQKNTDGIRIDTVYNNWVNKAPKNFTIDEAKKPKNKYFKLNLNSIGMLEMIYGHKLELKLNDVEVKWLEEQIDQIAVAFYLEGKPIVIRKVGGYEGCPEENVYTEKINGKEVTILNFCFSCTDSVKLDGFIKVFNKRTLLLLK